MARERHRIELMRHRVDRVRGVGALAVLAFVGIAGIYAGGWQGWTLGAVFLLLAVATGGWWWHGVTVIPRHGIPAAITDYLARSS
jgi:hypothetical protein